MASLCFSLFVFDVLMETNEKIQEAVKNRAITDVSSSITWVSILLLMWSEVITKRQNPRRLADVPRIWGDVFRWSQCTHFSVNISLALVIEPLICRNRFFFSNTE